MFNKGDYVWSRLGEKPAGNWYLFRVVDEIDEEEKLNVRVIYKSKSEGILEESQAYSVRATLLQPFWLQEGDILDIEYSQTRVVGKITKIYRGIVGLLNAEYQYVRETAKRKSNSVEYLRENAEFLWLRLENI